jgi:hypothetical protein
LKLKIYQIQLLLTWKRLGEISEDNFLKKTLNSSSMKPSRTSFVFICTLILLTSCTIEKRHYTSGYYVSWNKKLHSDNYSKKNEINLSDTVNFTREVLSDNEDDVFAGTESENHKNELSAGISSSNTFGIRKDRATGFSITKMLGEAFPKVIQEQQIEKTIIDITGKIRSLEGEKKQINKDVKSALFFLLVLLLILGIYILSIISSLNQLSYLSAAGLMILGLITFVKSIVGISRIGKEGVEEKGVLLSVLSIIISFLLMIFGLAAFIWWSYWL